MVYVFTVEAISGRVPPETLSEIFLYCAPSKDQSPAGTIPTWMSITHVCRRWRAVALAHAAFWTTITCQNAPLTRLMLERSRNATVSVAYRGHGHGTKGFRANFKLVEPHLKRVRDLDLVCRQDTYRTLIGTCIYNDSPVLETLSLSCRGGLPPIFNPALKLDSPPPHPPPTPAAGPRLRHLRLSGFPCPLASSEMDTLIAALQRMPNLATLTIAWAHPPAPIVFVPPPSPKQRIAPLPALRALHLAGLATHCAQFLHRVAPPPTAALDVHCLHEPALEHWADAHENLIGALHKLARERPPFTALAIGPMSCTGAILHAGYSPSPPPSSDADADADAPAGIFLDVHFPPQALAGGELCALAARVRDALPCAEIRTLSVHADIPVPAAWWREFALFSRIECVVLTHTAAAKGFVALLDGARPLQVEREVEGQGEPGKAQDGGVFLRSLNALSLSAVDMLAAVPGRAGMHVYDSLARGCRARKARGGALETLEVGRCRVRRRMVLKLSDFVGEVRWDKEEGKDWLL